MTDKNYQAIVDALDLLANATPRVTNGKITSVNVYKEAGISKATLYRYFCEYSELRETYDSLRKNGIKSNNNAPETIQQAYELIKDEVKKLRSEIAEVKMNYEHINKLKSHQIQLLWMHNEQLKTEIKRLLSNKEHLYSVT